LNQQHFDAFAKTLKDFSIVFGPQPIRKDLPEERSPAQDRRRDLRRIEHVQIELRRDLATKLDSLHTVAPRVQPGGKDTDAELAGQNRKNSARDSALRRRMPTR
jgi:hypothetical protein